MGHAAAGVVGAALGSGRRAVAVVGDGALLMQNEINTAVKYGARATWIVLNDARYGICAQGMQALGLHADASFPRVNFAALAYAQGAQGIVVRSELELDDALREALRADGPCVVDVQIDADCRAPADLRNASLASTQSAPRRAFPVG
jgi:acetolactate synthase-1/2/3 large subunit